MSETKKKIKRTNTVQIVGTLVETGNLAFDEEATNQKNPKIVGAITRVDFKKPAFVIESNGQKIGVSPMTTYKSKVDKDGKIVDNPQFKALEKIMEYEVGTRVMVKGSIAVGNPYMGKNGVVEPVSVQMFSMSSTSVPDEDFAEGKVSGYVKNIKNETRGEDEEETGRLLVDFWMYDDYNDAVLPFPLIVDEDIADDFENAFDNGDSVFFDFDIVSRKVGGKSESKGFGSRKSKIVSGFSVTEYSIFNGETVDDESEYYIDEDVFKTLFKAHKQKVEEAKNSKKDDEKPQKGLGSARKSKVDVDEDDDENPFDD